MRHLPLARKTPVFDSRNASMQKSSLRMARHRALIPFPVSHLEVNT
jgi:hypothetical protein